MEKQVYHESTKEKKNFVLSKFRVFVINPFWFHHSFLTHVKPNGSRVGIDLLSG
jgi:hypothetical protein